MKISVGTLKILWNTRSNLSNSMFAPLTVLLLWWQRFWQNRCHDQGKVGGNHEKLCSFRRKEANYSTTVVLSRSSSTSAFLQKAITITITLETSFFNFLILWVIWALQKRAFWEHDLTLKRKKHHLGEEKLCYNILHKVMKGYFDFLIWSSLRNAQMRFSK